MPRPVLALVLWALAVFAAEFSGCSRPEPPLATVGKQVVRNADFRAYLERTYPPERLARIRANVADRQQALEDYLDTVAVLAKARQRGIDQETRFKQAVRLMQMKTLSRLLTERYRERLVRGSQVSPEEVKAYYDQHRAEFAVEPRFTARHLLVYVKGNPAFPDQGRSDAEARAKAKQALAELRAGKSWDEVARTYSDEVPTRQKGGLIRDGQFGYFAPEVEHALRTQELGQPGEVIKSMFGYHVLQVEDRITERVPRPFAEVEASLTERLSARRGAEAGAAFMAPLRQEIGFELTEAGRRDLPLLDETAVAPQEVLARVAKKPIHEEDFRWFLQDALIPSQRPTAYSRPGARPAMLSSYLDQLVLEAKARREGLDRTQEYSKMRASAVEGLLLEFMQERDKAGPFCQCGPSEAERQAEQRKYFARVRAEVGLKVVGGPG